MQLYTEKLKAIAGVRYVFAFEMQSTSGTLNYFLVFASKHPLGLVKMKEAMKRIDQDDSYRFADADVSQPSLLRFDDPEKYAAGLHKHFEGRNVNYESFDNDITDYALNQTPFRNAKRMLATLEKQNLIHVVSQDAKRRFRAGSTTKCPSRGARPLRFVRRRSLPIRLTSILRGGGRSKCLCR